MNTASVGIERRVHLPKFKGSHWSRVHSWQTLKFLVVFIVWWCFRAGQAFLALRVQKVTWVLDSKAWRESPGCPACRVHLDPQGSIPSRRGRKEPSQDPRVWKARREKRFVSSTSASTAPHRTLSVLSVHAAAAAAAAAAAVVVCCCCCLYLCFFTLFKHFHFSDAESFTPLLRESKSMIVIASALAPRSCTFGACARQLSLTFHVVQSLDHKNELF